MTDDIDDEIVDEIVEKKLDVHNNFWALVYVWWTVTMILAGVGGSMYWFFF